MNRRSRQEIAAETVAILDRGEYRAPSGRPVVIADALAAAVTGTRLYRPDAPLLAADGGEPAPPATGGEGTPPAAGGTEARPRIEVTGETTLAAAYRLDASGGDAVCCLNFASAKNPGGGFRTGAQAQEESLARSSGLYRCLEAAPDYYEFHRRQRDPLYSDHMIYSPAVPVFRDDSGRLLERPYATAFITAPAPNAGAVRSPEGRRELPGVLRHRAARVLAVARAHGHTRLVLGAWGCGVFRNSPETVARAFRESLEGAAYAGAFTQVVFAVLDNAAGRPTFAAFEDELAGL